MLQMKGIALNEVLLLLCTDVFILTLFSEDMDEGLFEFRAN
jgi:hypothetical protein